MKQIDETYKEDHRTTITNILIYILIFLSFLLSSYDTLLSFKVKGFTVRSAQLILALFIAFVFYNRIKEKKVSLPIGFNFLIIWTFFILLFIPNTTSLLRNIGYGAWLLFHILILMSFVNYVKSQDMALVLLRLYLISFFVNSLLLIAEFIPLYFDLIVLPFVSVGYMDGFELMPRVGLFSYEPSYFATYLIAGLVLTVHLWIKNCEVYRKNNSFWLFLFFTTEVVALFLCNARSGYLVFALYLLYVVFEQFYCFIKDKTVNLRFLILIVVFIIGAIGIFFLFKKAYKINILERIFIGTGIFSEKGASITGRLKNVKETLKVFLNHPIIGVSLGGVPAARGELIGKVITSQAEAKHLEGMVVLLEVLAASGVIGFLFFLLYFLKLTIKPFFEKNIVLKALVLGLIFEFIMLQFNQNIQRLYFWLHIAVLSMCYEVYGKGKEKFMRLESFW